MKNALKINASTITTSDINALEIIDCHTHAGIDYFWNQTHVHPNSQTINELLRKMDCNNVNYAIVFPMASSPYYTIDGLLAKKFELSGIEEFPYEQSNKMLSEQIIVLDNKSRERFLVFFCFNPQDKTLQQISFLEKNLEDGLIRGLKYHPYACQTHLTSEKNRLFLEFAQSNSLPIVVHYGLDEFSSGKKLLELVSKYDHVNFSFAHIARFDDNILRHMNDLDNMFFDVSCLSGECKMASGFNLTGVYKGYARRDYDFHSPSGVLKRLIKDFPDSVLWGTDEPFTSLRDDRTEYYSSSYSSESGILMSLAKEDMRIVASKNPRKFLRLG